MTAPLLSEAQIQALVDDTGADQLRALVESAIRQAVKLAGEEAAKVAMDMPLNNADFHEYRWSDTGKAVAWDISHAIRARLG